MNPLCDKAGYNNGTAGNPTCGIYIGVQCHENDVMCAYKLNLKIYEDDQIVFSNLPHYITWNHDYLQGAVKYYESEYFYLPIDPNTIGDFAVLVNKTTPYKSENGDLNLTMIIHPGAGLKYW